jgi:hypothetical protein
MLRLGPQTDITRHALLVGLVPEADVSNSARSCGGHFSSSTTIQPSLIVGVELFCRLDDFPSSGKASGRNESVAWGLLSVLTQELRAALTGLLMMLPNVSDRRSATRAARSLAA